MAMTAFARHVFVIDSGGKAASTPHPELAWLYDLKAGGGAAVKGWRQARISMAE
jgi:hypothetical protein